MLTSVLHILKTPKHVSSTIPGRLYSASSKGQMLLSTIALYKCKFTLHYPSTRIEMREKNKFISQIPEKNRIYRRLQFNSVVRACGE